MFYPQLTNKFYRKLKQTAVESLLGSNYNRIPYTREAGVNSCVPNLFLENHIIVSLVFWKQALEYQLSFHTNADIGIFSRIS
jgi:hypothetical protein